MIATYEGSNAKSLILVGALKQVEDDAMAATVGLAPRIRIATPASVEEQPAPETRGLGEAHGSVVGIWRHDSIVVNESGHGKGGLEEHKS